MKAVKRMTLVPLVALAILVPLSAHAEEGGSGHYAPGANASFIPILQHDNPTIIRKEKKK